MPSLTYPKSFKHELDISGKEIYCPTSLSALALQGPRCSYSCAGDLFRGPESDAQTVIRLSVGSAVGVVIKAGREHLQWK